MGDSPSLQRLKELFEIVDVNHKSESNGIISDSNMAWLVRVPNWHVHYDSNVHGSLSAYGSTEDKAASRLLHIVLNHNIHWGTSCTSSCVYHT